VIALVGENGSGKTTLAKILAGLYRPQDGTVCWDGTSIADVEGDPLRERIAVIAQDHGNWPLTVRDNIIMGRPLDEALLGAAAAASGADELTSGQFRPILTRVLGTPGPEPVRLLLYTGKIGAELAAAHESAAHESGGPAVLLLSVEQLYPLPVAEIAAAIQAAPALAEVAWLQEEPENMGAWPAVKDALAAAIGRPPRYLGRPPRVVPAQGSSAYHQQEQETLITAALAPPANDHEESA